MNKYLRDLVEHDVEITPTLRRKSRQPRHPKLAAARSAAANFARRLCRVFPRNCLRNVGVIFNQTVLRLVHLPFLNKLIKIFTEKMPMRPKADTLPVQASVIDLWEKMFNHTPSHDLTFETIVAFAS